MNKSTVASMTLALALAITSKAAPLDIVDVTATNPQFSTLLQALKAADLLDALRGGPITVLAPTNEAFEKLPEQQLNDLLKPENRDQLISVLKYHVLPGRATTLAQLLPRGEWKTLQDETVIVRFVDGRVRVNDAVLETADIACANGTIHVIDTVLIPPRKGPGNLAQTAAAAGNFEFLLAAVKAAGLAEALTGEGPLTVFAPTDEAFGKLPQSTLDELLQPENKQRLAEILKYHVVSGSVTAGDALNAGKAGALNGGDLEITFVDGAITVQGAKVLAVDVEAANGLIHVIDTVLLPPDARPGSTTEEALDMITQAISRGVPAFNRGDSEGCAKIYLAVSTSLLEDHDLPAPARSALEHAVGKASDARSDRSRAWTLRHGLDRAYAALTHSGMR